MSNLVPFIVYDAVGNILQHGSCADTDLSLQVPPTGCTVMGGDGTYHSHYVKDGAIVAYTDYELGLKNNLPKGHVWQMPERIVVDTRGLEDAKTQAWERIKISRSAAEKAPFECDGSLYDRDLERISGAVQLALLAQLASKPFTIDWTLFDNSVKTLDGPAMIAVGEAMGVVTKGIFDTARTLREEINAATTITSLDAIFWPP